MLHTASRERLIGWCRQALRFVLPVECISCGRMSLSTDPIPFFCTACWDRITPMPAPAVPAAINPSSRGVHDSYTGPSMPDIVWSGLRHMSGPGRSSPIFLHYRMRSARSNIEANLHWQNHSLH